MTLEEKVYQTLYNAPAIERLGIASYNWWNEALHGVARAGTATVFPQAIGLAATFDEDFMEQIGDAVSTEARGKFNMQQEFGDHDIYKGLTPLVAAELIALRKQADAAQEEKLYNIAKKYEIIGKKPEELVPTLKALQAAGGTAYDDMIGVLDGAVAAVEKSGLFGEVGKRGAGATGGTDAWSKIEKKAEEIRKSNAALSYAESIDAACVQNPDLVHEYEATRR